MDTIEIVRAALAGRPVNVVDGMNELIRARAMDLVQGKYNGQAEEEPADEDQDDGQPEDNGGDDEEA